MASVRNQYDPAPQTASNTVLFEMMMHYKRRAERAESECEHQRKRARIMEEVWEEEIDAREQQLEIANMENVQLVRANVRGAEMVLRKHNAAMQLMSAAEDLFNAVDVADQLAPAAERWVIDYVAMHKQAAQQRANVAFEIMIQEPGVEVEVHPMRVMNLQAEEELEPTGDTTEEETDSEYEVEI